MKKLLFTALLFISFIGLGQDGINYKAVIKDGNGDIIANEAIEVQFRIRQGSSVGTILYHETHSPTTDANGIIILNIGEGTPLTGSFATIDWGSLNQFLNVQIDTGGGLQNMGTTAFKTVPYAMYAKTTSSSSSITDADNNTKIQVEEGANDDKIRFDIDGTEQLVIEESANGGLLFQLPLDNGHNTFFGRDAGLLNTRDSFDGYSNTYFGNSVGENNVSGSYNSFFGRSAGTSFSSGDWNTIVGAQSGDAFTSGTGNTFIGYANYGNQVVGDNNTSLGTSAGGLRTGGDNNTFLGYRAGRNETTGSGNVFIGYNAGSQATGDNKLYIDNSSTSSPLIYGDFDTNLLQCNGDFYVNGGTLGVGESSPVARVHIKSDSGEDPLSIYINTSKALHMESDGKLLVGAVVSPTAKIQLDANPGEDAFRAQIAGSTKFLVHHNGGIGNTNATPIFAFNLQNSATDLLGRGRAFSWNTYSDRRIKSNIRNIDYGLQTILKLRPTAYEHHNSLVDEESGTSSISSETTPDIGLIAQEVYKLVPEAVSKPANSEDLWSMDYTRLVPVLIKGMQDQQDIIANRTSRIEELEAKLSEKETALNAMNERIEKIEKVLVEYN